MEDDKSESTASESFSSDEEISYAPLTLKTMATSKKMREVVLKDMSFISSASTFNTEDSTTHYRELQEFFSEMICGLTGNITVYPKSMENDLEGSENCIFKKLKDHEWLKEGSFVFLARSLAVTLNIDNPRIRLPQSVMFDVCIFTYSHPVLVLTAANGMLNDVSLCGEYNTFVARAVTEELRKEDYSVCVLNGVLDQTSDIGLQLTMFQERTQFTFLEAITMSQVRCEALLKHFLTTVATYNTFPLWDGTSSQRINKVLNREEFECLIEALDGTTEFDKIKGCSLPFIVEVLCRLSRGYSIMLDLQCGVVPDCVNEKMRHFAPLMEICDSTSIDQIHIDYDYKVVARRYSGKTKWTFSSLKKTPYTFQKSTTGGYHPGRTITTRGPNADIYIVVDEKESEESEDDYDDDIDADVESICIPEHKHSIGNKIKNITRYCLKKLQRKKKAPPIRREGQHYKTMRVKSETKKTKVLRRAASTRRAPHSESSCWVASKGSPALTSEINSDDKGIIKDNAGRTLETFEETGHTERRDNPTRDLGYSSSMSSTASRFLNESDADLDTVKPTVYYV